MNEFIDGKDKSKFVVRTKTGKIVAWLKLGKEMPNFYGKFRGEEHFFLHWNEAFPLRKDFPTKVRRMCSLKHDVQEGTYTDLSSVKASAKARQVCLNYIDVMVDTTDGLTYSSDKVLHRLKSVKDALTLLDIIREIDYCFNCL